VVTRYELDPERSRVDIHATSSVHPIDSSAAVTGWIELDGDQPVDGEVTVDLTRIRSGNPLIDREAERRLAVRKHPTVTGRLTGSGRGDLTLRGVTGEITGDLHVTASGDEVSVEGSTEFDVTDFGIQPPSLLVIKVHATVRVELHAEGTAPPTE
jgi:polyisoprenoid-binding protein YceI